MHACRAVPCAGAAQGGRGLHRLEGLQPPFLGTATALSRDCNRPDQRHGGWLPRPATPLRPPWALGPAASAGQQQRQRSPATATRPAGRQACPMGPDDALRQARPHHAFRRRQHKGGRRKGPPPPVRARLRLGWASWAGQGGGGPPRQGGPAGEAEALWAGACRHTGQRVSSVQRVLTRGGITYHMMQRRFTIPCECLWCQSQLELLSGGVRRLDMNAVQWARDAVGAATNCIVDGGRPPRRHLP